MSINIPLPSKKISANKQAPVFGMRTGAYFYEDGYFRLYGGSAYCTSTHSTVALPMPMVNTPWSVE